MWQHQAFPALLSAVCVPQAKTLPSQQDTQLIRSSVSNPPRQRSGPGVYRVIFYPRGPLWPSSSLSLSRGCLGLLSLGQAGDAVFRVFGNACGVAAAEQQQHPRSTDRPGLLPREACGCEASPRASSEVLLLPVSREPCLSRTALCGEVDDRFERVFYSVCARSQAGPSRFLWAARIPCCSAGVAATASINLSLDPLAQLGVA